MKRKTKKVLQCSRLLFISGSVWTENRAGGSYHKYGNANRYAGANGNTEPNSDAKSNTNTDSGGDDCGK